MSILKSTMTVHGSWVLLFFVLTSCLTVQQPDPKDLTSQKSPSKSGSKTTKPSTSAVVDDQWTNGTLPQAQEPQSLENPSLSDYEQGFCIDDLYSQYLLSKAGPSDLDPSQIAPRSAKKSKKRSKRVRKDTFKRDSLSYSFVRDRMNGPSSPYFGGIPIVINPQVDSWLQFFKTSGRRMFLSWLTKAESVRGSVIPQLQAQGVPAEFLYLAMIESGFSNHARSPAKAKGTWQFIPSTARLYGLKINTWVDERKDPVKSTAAAARYLKDLYTDLGDWHLAMAAYNAGPGRIKQAIKRAQTNDFWKLYQSKHLPTETKNYVPKVLAAIIISNNPEHYGFLADADPKEHMPLDHVVVTTPSRVSDLAALFNIDSSALKKWNPELLKDQTPPYSERYLLRVTRDLAENFPVVSSALLSSQKSKKTFRQADASPHAKGRDETQKRKVSS